MSHRILHEMKLATLPRHIGKDLLPGGLEHGMVVADDELDALHAVSDKALEELPPVRLGLGDLHPAAEDAAITIRAALRSTRTDIGSPSRGTAVALGGTTDADLATVAERWSSLPREIRLAIVALVSTAASHTP